MLQQTNKQTEMTSSLFLFSFCSNLNVLVLLLVSVWDHGEALRVTEQWKQLRAADVSKATSCLRSVDGRTWAANRSREDGWKSSWIWVDLQRKTQAGRGSRFTDATTLVAPRCETLFTSELQHSGDALKKSSVNRPLLSLSAGIGRTGCFIVGSIGCQQLRESGQVDILETVCQLRLDRWVTAILPVLSALTFVLLLTVAVLTSPSCAGVEWSKPQSSTSSCILCWPSTARSYNTTRYWRRVHRFIQLILLSVRLQWNDTQHFRFKL